MATDEGAVMLAEEVEALFASLKPTSEASYLVSGGGVANVSGFTFRVSAGQAFIRGTLYSIPQTDLTLGAAHATLPRIDLIVANTDGTYSVLAGTAAANPELPNIDPTTQLQVTLILVPATATSIPTIVQTALYHEATETTITTANGRIVGNSTNNPLAGTKDIEGTACVADDWVKLTNASTIDITAANQLVLNIRSKAAWSGAKNLQLTWFNGAAKVGQIVSIADKLFGFVSATTGAYQQIVIPISNFKFTSGNLVDALEIRVKGGGGSIGFYLDDIYIESSSVISTPTPSGSTFIVNDPGKPNGNVNSLTFDSGSLGGATIVNPTDLTYDVNLTVPGSLWFQVARSTNEFKGFLWPLLAGDFTIWLDYDLAVIESGVMLLALILTDTVNPTGGNSSVTMIGQHNSFNNLGTWYTGQETNFGNGASSSKQGNLKLPDVSGLLGIARSGSFFLPGYSVRGDAVMWRSAQHTLSFTPTFFGVAAYSNSSFDTEVAIKSINYFPTYKARPVGRRLLVDTA